MSDALKPGSPSDRPGEHKKVGEVSSLPIVPAGSTHLTTPTLVPPDTELGLPRKVYRVGTLRYTTTGLVILFAWLLWSDFCYTLLQIVVPSILPLKLRDLGSANWVIALIISTLPGIFNTTVCPWVSFKSDHYRSRWGRRIPFIVYTMPFLTASLILIGLSDQIGTWLHGWFLSGTVFTRGMVIVFLLALFAGMFDLFNMFVGSVYWYLFNDVVPERFLARFMSWFQLVYVATTALYNYFIYQYALSHMREIFIGVGLLYFVGFGLMCLRVREGEYPPPPDTGEAPGLLKDIRTFARECFTMPYYWNIFLYTTAVQVAGTAGVFGVFLSQSLGLDLNLIGKMSAVSGVLVAVCLIFAGILVDRWHPVRVEAYLQSYNTFFAFAGLIWLFADAPSPSVLFWVAVIASPFSALMSATQTASNLPRLMILFPRDRFGAFCGAMALVRSAGTMIGGLLAGVFLDIVRRFYSPGDLFPYRFIPLWSLTFQIIALYFHYRAYRYWKRLGGDAGYVPPTTNIRYGDLPPAPRAGVTRVLLGLPILAFIGMIAVNGFYVYYYWFIVQNTRSAIAFGVYIGLAFFVMLAYLRFVKFMERP